ncbi:maturase [Dorcoceras hygrometricum]|uniref:Maturase n=1 Tax=Dorcoceras hygrometricum TaxID=472368 RepID=A0A2Z7AD29_9LAMI|nr:maturase [Dorcoceras hygrometricum]
MTRSRIKDQLARFQLFHEPCRSILKPRTGLVRTVLQDCAPLSWFLQNDVASLPVQDIQLRINFSTNLLGLTDVVRKAVGEGGGLWARSIAVNSSYNGGINQNDTPKALGSSLPAFLVPIFTELVLSSSWLLHRAVLFLSFLLLSCFELACLSYSAGRFFELISQLVFSPAGFFIYCSRILLPVISIQLLRFLIRFSPLIWFTSSALFFLSRAIVCLLVHLVHSDTSSKLSASTPFFHWLSCNPAPVSM